MGYIFRQYRRQRLLIGFPDGPDGAECLSQLRLPLRPQTGDAVQYRAHGAFGVMLVVIGDGKAVGLLLNLPHKRKHRWNLCNADLPPIRRDQGTGAVAVILHHAKHWDGQAKLLQHPHRHRRMFFTAIDEKHVRQLRSKRFICL